MAIPGTLYPRFEKVGGILVYICPSFRPSVLPSVLPSVRPSVRPSVTLFRHRYLHSRLRQNVHIWYIGRQRQVVSWKLRTGILLLFILPYIYPFFFLLRFSSTISPQLYRIGSSYLVYRITTTNCIVGKIMAMSCLFFLIFVIFSFSPSNQ